MKKEYELVQWYPSLPLGWSPEHEYLFDGKTNIISNLSKLEDCFKTEHEINLIELDFPNYWKEKPKPLFIPEKRKFKAGDKVRIKDGISSKTHGYTTPSFTITMDRFIGKELTVRRYRNGYISFNEDDYGYQFHEDWLIEKPKPLFVTEDGVECFEDRKYILIGTNFQKHYLIATKEMLSEGMIRFKHESNADEYIWKNKRMFNYQDMMKAKHSIILTDEDIEKAAKERSCNG